MSETRATYQTPALLTPEERASQQLDTIETELAGPGESRYIWTDLEAAFAKLYAHIDHLTTEHAADCAGLIKQIQLRDKELAEIMADKQGIAPALLTPERLVAITDALAEERQGCEAEPATPLGYWPTAVAALLGHARAANWGTEDVQASNRLLRTFVEALTARALKAEARGKEQQAELAEQEVDKLALLTEVQALRNANFRLEKEADKNYTGYRFS